MHEDRTTLLATAIVLGTGALWGFYWLPVRVLSEMGLTGAWGTLAITSAAMLMLLPVAIARWRQFVRSSPVALVSFALGGAASRSTRSGLSMAGWRSSSCCIF